ncbi:hypothetical protein M378DRAFT_174631 [Amanita muscaria Koide BX008]|uniref:glutathione peroxidase n=1 Tax=Amanita muscaria (strain Koide BX008) TaxID=946122 RepID=A0A0C2XA48_AMAMK|nr:hypothetical protein M378DRAFT_174631 [Amanita muscaria Koide BX008]
MSSVKDLNTITNHRVVIFSKSYCPYCKRAKAIFASEYKDEKPEVLELDERDDGEAIQKYLVEKTKQRTVPNVFVTQKHIGGSDDLVVANDSGELQRLLSA